VDVRAILAKLGELQQADSPSRPNDRSGMAPRQRDRDGGRGEPRIGSWRCPVAGRALALAKPIPRRHTEERIMDTSHDHDQASF
jgi:hypothetical protein